jgi:hypothetical protein
MNKPTRTSEPPTGRRLCLIASASAAAALAGFGCQSSHLSAERAANPTLRPIVAPANSTTCDADRAALSRFVGVWTFEGWSANPGETHVAVAGRAAGVIEREHFVLLDLQTTAGALGGRNRNRSVSMLLGCEPGLGATVTAWGDTAPSIGRLVGRVEGNGAAFAFTEVRPPAGVHPMSLTMTFETDDRWVAEMRDCAVDGQPVIAKYTFTRSAN